MWSRKREHSMGRRQNQVKRVERGTERASGRERGVRGG
jgi:hypothetical protein